MRIKWHNLLISGGQTALDDTCCTKSWARFLRILNDLGPQGAYGGESSSNKLSGGFGGRSCQSYTHVLLVGNTRMPGVPGDTKTSRLHLRARETSH